jgi:hypothetical protein
VAGPEASRNRISGHDSIVASKTSHRSGIAGRGSALKVLGRSPSAVDFLIPWTVREHNRAPGSAWFHDEFRQESVAQLLCYVLSQTLDWTKGDVDAAQLGDRLDIGVSILASRSMSPALMDIPRLMSRDEEERLGPRT